VKTFYVIGIRREQTDTTAPSVDYAPTFVNRVPFLIVLNTPGIRIGYWLLALESRTRRRPISRVFYALRVGPPSAYNLPRSVTSVGVVARITNSWTNRETTALPIVSGHHRFADYARFFHSVQRVSDCFRAPITVEYKRCSSLGCRGPISPVPNAVETFHGVTLFRQTGKRNCFRQPESNR